MGWRIEKAPQEAFISRNVGQVRLIRDLCLLHSLCTCPRSSVPPVSLVLVLSVWLTIFPPRPSQGVPWSPRMSGHLLCASAESRVAGME